MNDDILNSIFPLDSAPEGGDPAVAAGGAAPEGGGEGGEGGEGGGSGTPAGNPQLAKQMATLIQTNKELKDKIDEIEKRGVRTVDVTTPGVQPFTGTPPANQLEAIKDALGKKLMTDPGGALLDAITLGAQIAQQQQGAAMQPYLAGQSQMIVDGFLKGKQSDDIPPAVYQEFQAGIERATKERGIDISKLPPAQLQQGLEDLWEQSIGRVALKARSSRKAPPPYSTGSGGGAGNFAVIRGGAIDALEARDAVEEEIISTMRGLQMSDDDIKATLKAKREDIA